MDELQIKNIIKVWYGKARREDDKFLKFFLLWICFNAWLEHSSGEDRDYKMIDWLINKETSSDLKESYELCIKDKEFKEHLKFLAYNSPYKDSRGKRSDIEIKDENDFKNIVRAIYRIRCNLFHGGTQAQQEIAKKQIAISTNILNKWIATLSVKLEII